MAGPGAEDHASIEVLDDYHAGRLSATEEDQVREHLVLCKACQGLMLDWAEFQSEERRPSRFWSAELSAAWDEWLDLKAQKQESLL